MTRKPKPLPPGQYVGTFKKDSKGRLYVHLDDGRKIPMVFPSRAEPPRHIDPWDEIIHKILSEQTCAVQDTLAKPIREALRAAYRKGYDSGRRSGYDEASQQLTPTRHEMGG